MLEVYATSTSYAFQRLRAARCPTDAANRAPTSFRIRLYSIYNKIQPTLSALLISNVNCLLFLMTQSRSEYILELARELLDDLELGRTGAERLMPKTVIERPLVAGLKPPRKQVWFILTGFEASAIFKREK